MQLTVPIRVLPDRIALSQPESNVNAGDATEDQILGGAFRYALSLSGHHHDAEDLVQEAGLRLYRKYGGIKSRGLIFTTIRNIFYDQARRRKIVAFDSLEARQEAQGIDEAAEAKECEGQAGDIATLLANLQADEREIIFLHYVSGHTAREIADLIGSPRNTILSKLSRARKKLEGMIAEPAKKNAL